MPEVILPCPACGSIDCECLFAEDEMYSVDCVDCSMRGPAERNPDSAIAAWNAIPRALPWTDEPPTVIGWYFRRFWRGWIKNRWDTPDIIYVDNEHIKRGVRKIGGTQWAGPISPPID